MSNRKMMIGIGCGVVILSIAGALVCGGVGWYFWRSATNDGEISDEVDRLFTSIADNQWEGEYTKSTTPEFRQVTNAQQFNRIGELVRTHLGALKSKTLENLSFQTFNGTTNYNVVYEAEFERGAGTIRATLRRVGSRWLMHGLFVSSPEFEKDFAALTCSKCGRTYAETAKFCPHCGERVDEVSESPPSEIETIPEE